MIALLSMVRCPTPFRFFVRMSDVRRVDCATTDEKNGRIGGVGGGDGIDGESENGNENENETWEENENGSRKENENYVDENGVDESDDDESSIWNAIWKDSVWNGTFWTNDSGCCVDREGVCDPDFDCDSCFGYDPCWIVVRREHLGRLEEVQIFQFGCSSHKKVLVESWEDECRYGVSQPERLQCVAAPFRFAPSIARAPASFVQE